MSVKFEIKNLENFKNEIKELESKIPNEVRDMILSVALVDIESFIKTHDIPIDTGRLRASIYTKYIKNLQHNYNDNQGNNYDGDLNVNIDIDSVAVGTNVVYAEQINAFGGGGPNSARVYGGLKRNKGYGKGFFDNAIMNGKKRLKEELNKLAKRVEKL